MHKSLSNHKASLFGESTFFRRQYRRYRRIFTYSAFHAGARFRRRAARTAPSMRIYATTLNSKCNLVRPAA